MIPPGCLLDTGPLVALLNKSDHDHERTKKLFESILPPLRTCEAVITEACFLVNKVGYEGSREVLFLGKKGFYQVSIALKDHWLSIEVLLNKYKNLPISLADACLIRCAEIYEEPRILTFDSDFKIYRWGRNKRFQILEE